MVEIADEISGPYCGKLLVDLGADVTKIEAPEGDPLRRWGPFPGGQPDPDRAGLFEYLNAGKRGAVLDVTRDSDAAAARRLIADADVLIDGSAPGTLGGATARRFTVWLSCGSQTSDSTDLFAIAMATPLTMQAVSGWISARDPDRPPVQAGARIAEYVAGAYAALGALTALRIAPVRSGDRGRCLGVGGTAVDAAVPDADGRTHARARPAVDHVRQAPMLGVVRAADGWVGINCLTGQHWLDVCAMLGLPEFGEQQFAIMMGGPERAEFFAAAQPWLSERTVADIVELSQALRIPAAPVADGASALDISAVRQARLLRRRRRQRTGRFDVRGRLFGCRRRRRRPSGPRRVWAKRPRPVNARADRPQADPVADPSLPFAGPESA